MNTNIRTTHGHRGGLALFLIGMRINAWWRIDCWLPAFLAMPRMLRELEAISQAADRGAEEDLGFLGYRLFLAAGGPTVVQYWRSVDDIYRYASAADHEHHPAWRAFNARLRKSPGAVGVWHETYAVSAGGHESVYVNMPASGLAAATSVVPVARRGQTARERIAS